jgi:hypothetical protein
MCLSVCSKRWTWALYQNNIVTLRNINGTVECYYAAVNGTGDNRHLTFIALGGQPVVDDWMLQCDAANYQAIPNFDSQPYCVTAGDDDRTAYSSTLLMHLTFTPASGGGGGGNNGGNSTDTSDAETLVMSFLYAFTGVAGAAALLN